MPDNAPLKPCPSPRAIGVIYLLYFLAAFIGLYLMSGVIVSGNSLETANNLIAHATTFRAGVAVDVTSNVLYVVLIACFYRLFEPVGPSLSSVAACVGLAGCCILLVAEIFRVAPLLLLTHAPLASSFSGDQLRNLALLSFSLHSQCFYIALVVFGVYDLCLGILVFRSGYLPRAIGILLVCAGIGWMVFLWPPLATAMSPAVLPLGALAEIVLMLWLIVRGDDTQKRRPL